MESIIESIPFSNWTELVTDLRKNENGSMIYRGHSNDYRLTLAKKPHEAFLSADFSKTSDFISWSLISSFDRYYKGHFYKFNSFLHQQLEDNIFRSKYGSYNLSEISYLKYCTQLERIYYLQHYGVHTCFMDFSQDPLIALFFSIANVRSSNIYNVDRDYNKFIHPSEAYVSCYELNHDKISELFNIAKLDKDFSYKNYGSYRVKNCNAYLAFDLMPIVKCQPDTINENLKLQKGCFVLYDNNGSYIPLDKLIDRLFFYENKDKEVVIKEYRLPYNEIFAKHNFEEFEDISLVNYLNRKGISGKYLFNDIQGLKYDLNFLHD
jgi:hypothetical protein